MFSENLVGIMISVAACRVRCYYNELPPTRIVSSQLLLNNSFVASFATCLYSGDHPPSKFHLIYILIYLGHGVITAVLIKSQTM